MLIVKCFIFLYEFHAELNEQIHKETSRKMKAQTTVSVICTGALNTQDVLLTHIHSCWKQPVPGERKMAFLRLDQSRSPTFEPPESNQASEGGGGGGWVVVEGMGGGCY